MSDAFIKIVNMSVSASCIALAVMALRLFFKRVPKWIVCSAWALVALRLLMPFTVESYFSLVPDMEKIEEKIPVISFVSQGKSVSAGAETAASRASSPDVVNILSIVWIVGMTLMIIYSLAIFLRIKLKTRVSIKIEDGVYICDLIPSPFLLGLFVPKIYIPSSTSKEERLFIVSHEKAHKKRGDFVWKPLGFLLLSVYWFNPLMWVAYVFLCRDIEYACDEKVVRTLGTDIKRQYSETLLKCSVTKRMLAACPVAFAEAGLKQRIKKILNYKRPAVWIVAIFAVITTVFAVCFLTDPKRTEQDGEEPAEVPVVLCADGHDFKVRSVVEPTCATYGYTYLECSACGKTETELTEPFAHEFTSALVSPASCAHGDVTGFTCSACGYYYEETGDVTNEHDYSISEVTLEARCATAGERRISCSVCGDSYTEEIPETGHAFAGRKLISASCSDKVAEVQTFCGKCGFSYYEEIPIDGHSYLAATCSAPETCKLCGETRGAPLGHTKNGWCDYCYKYITDASPTVIRSFDYASNPDYDTFGNFIG